MFKSLTLSHAHSHSKNSNIQISKKPKTQISKYPKTQISRGWLVPHRRPRGRRGPPSVERGINTAVGACLPPRAWRRRREHLVVRLHVPAPAASTSALAFLLLGISSMCCVLSSSLLAQLGPRELGGVHRVMPRKGCSWWPASWSRA
jgi:hypothetical protein